MNAPVRIAVDAMGGDFGPSVVVLGAIRARRRLSDRARLLLVGDEPIVTAEIEAAGENPAEFDLVHAPENIDMHEAPAAAIRRKPNSSIVVGTRLIKDGKADAFVSAGSTGAVAAASLLILGRIKGVVRPGIATLTPTKRGTGIVIDVGSNVDSKPAHLLQFAAMGRIYAEHVLGHPTATVGLLNIGEEASKGDELTQEAYKLLAAAEPRFIGNVEGRDIFEGKATVIVCDGFVGNVVLKTVEAFGSYLPSTFLQESRFDIRARLGLLLMRPALRKFFRRFNASEYGGAPLLGCEGVTIICHGGSNPLAITNGIRAAERGVRDRINDLIRKEIEREAAELGSDPKNPSVEGARP